MRDKFSKWESVCILANALLYRSETYAAGIAFKTSGSGGTLAAVIAGIIALIIIYFLLSVYQKCDGVPVTRLLKSTTPRAVISYAVALFLLISAVGALYSFSSLMKSIAYPNTPMWYLFIFFAIAAIVGGLGKKRSIAAAHAILFPIAAAVIAVLCLSSLAHADISNLFPIFGFGGGRFFSAVCSSLSLYVDAILIFLVVEDLSEPKSLKRVGMTAAGLAVIINIAIPLCFQLITRNMSELTSVIPIYALTESVSYGRFFQHPAALFPAFWAMSGILYCAAAIHYALRSVRNLKGEEVSSH